jgi:hypothetical protein
MHGFAQGVEYIRNNIDEYDVLCIQEHWLYPSNLHLFNSLCNNYECHAVSSMQNDNVIRVGRPFGGLAVMWKKAINNSVRVTCMRICVISENYISI